MQFFTAGRVGELARIQWSNVDIANRRLLIKETCVWDMSTKMFIVLKKFPKNRETRVVFITDEIMQILERRKAFRIPGNDYLFHIVGKPLNYGTIQINYREAKGKVEYHTQELTPFVMGWQSLPDKLVEVWMLYWR